MVGYNKLVGWLLMVIIAELAIDQMLRDVGRDHGVMLAADVISDLVVMSMLWASIWRDRLAKARGVQS